MKQALCSTTAFATLIDHALEALEPIARSREPIAGLPAFQRRIEREISLLQRARDRLGSKGGLEVRGTASGGDKENAAKKTGKEFGGRPPRESMCRVAQASPDQVARIQRLPARALNYARQKSDSVEAAVEWLCQKQPEFGGNAPLYVDRRLQRKYSRLLKMEPRSC